MLLSIMHFPDTFACPKVLEYLHVSPNIWFVWFTERLSRGDFYFYVDWLLYTMYERTNLSLDQQQFVFITSTSKKLSFVGFSRAKISVLLSLHPQWYQTWLPPFKNAPTTNIFAYNHLHNTLYVSLFYLCNDCKKSIHPSTVTPRTPGKGCHLTSLDVEVVICWVWEARVGDFINFD